jgi:hypothetical protein
VKKPTPKSKPAETEGVAASEAATQEAQNESFGQEKELTIESLANSCNDELNQQAQEELTLSGMVRNLNENFKKAKKEKEKEVKAPTKRLPSKAKSRRVSADKDKDRSEEEDGDEGDEEEENEEEEEEEDEPKRKRKTKKLDEVSEESNSSNTRASKRKSSTSRPDEESESESEKEKEKDKEKKSEAAKNLPSHDADGKKIYRSCDIEPNKIVEVKYGSGKTTYHAKIVQIDEQNQTMRVHYLGWNNRYNKFILFYSFFSSFD